MCQGKSYIGVGHICGPFRFNKTDECEFQKKNLQYLVECAIEYMQLGVYDENKNVQVLTNKDQIMATSDDADYKFQKVYKPNVIRQSPTIYFLFSFPFFSGLIQISKLVID